MWLCEKDAFTSSVLHVHPEIVGKNDIILNVDLETVAESKNIHGVLAILLQLTELSRYNPSWL